MAHVPEVYDFIGHPILPELEKAASRILRVMEAQSHSAKALYVAQECLIDELLEIEGTSSQFKLRAKQLRAQASGIALSARQHAATLSEDAKLSTKALYEEAQALDDSRQVLQYGSWLLRYVGDGIAWHALHHNRRLIRALAAKQPVGFLPPRSEFAPMRRLFRGVRRLGPDWLPLLHDLTNCLRTADMSVFRSGSLYRVVEFKIRQGGKANDESTPLPSQPKNDRERRQRERMESIFRYLATKDLGDLDPRLAGGRDIDSDTPERHNFTSISDVIAQARSTGFGLVSPEPPLLYVSWDVNKSTIEEVMAVAATRFPKIFAPLLTFRSVSARADRPEGLPITAMGLPVQDMLEILFGRIAVTVILNLTLLEGHLSNKGIPLRVLKKDGGGVSLQVMVGEVPGEVREGLMDRSLLEALSIESFAGLIRSIIEQFPNLHLPTSA